MIGCVLGRDVAEADERLRALYAARPRETAYDEFAARYRERALVGGVDEIAERLRAYADAGAERAMLQHLLHRDLETVALIGRELGPAVA